jgi:PPM family protein phosphatase
MHIYGRTDRGHVRVNNQDCFNIDLERGIAVLADGMGGLNAGEVASACAVHSAMDVLRRLVAELHAPQERLTEHLSDVMRAAFDAANRAVHEMAASTISYSGMGTTLIAALLRNDACVVGHVGDSRAYRFRTGRLTRLTSDHSLVQELVDAGVLSQEDARRAPNRSMITRAVGLESDVVCDLHVDRFVSGDWLLLCSDGLTDMLDDAAIQRHCEHVAGAGSAADGGHGLRQLVDGLLSAALDSGGVDNVTIIGLRC